MMPAPMRRPLEAQTDLSHFEMSNEELERAARPTPEINRFRNVFWAEYEDAQREARRMSWANITSRVAIPVMLIMREMYNPARLAYVLRPPTTYDDLIYEAHQKGFEEMRKIFDLPNVNGDGKIDHKVIDLKLKVTMYLDQRIKGGIVQKTVNYNMDQKMKTAPAPSNQSLPLEEIERKIKELESGNGDRPIKEIEAPEASGT
jgi:hypothetical protein